MMLLSFCLTVNLTAEEGQKASFPELKGPFLGQPAPGKKAAVFAPGIISVEGRYEFAVSFSPGGNEMIYTSADPKTNAYRIMFTKISEGKWSAPVEMNLSRGERKEEMEGFFTPDGSHIYFAPYNEGMDVRIWAVKREGSGWSKPRELDYPVNDAPAFYPTVSATGNLYYSNIKERKIYRASPVEGQYKTTEPAGVESGLHGFIAPDESFILFDARREDSRGKMDIYAAFRDSSGAWSSPVSLGPEVNTPFSESCPSLSHDGRYIFFSRYNEPGDISNIYWISSGILEELKPKADKIP